MGQLQHEEMLLRIVRQPLVEAKLESWPRGATPSLQLLVLRLGLLQNRDVGVIIEATRFGAAGRHSAGRSECS
jgi:hypothetical protein